MSQQVRVDVSAATDDPGRAPRNVGWLRDQVVAVRALSRTNGEVYKRVNVLEVGIAALRTDVETLRSEVSTQIEELKTFMKELTNALRTEYDQRFEVVNEARTAWDRCNEILSAACNEAHCDTYDWRTEEERYSQTNNSSSSAVVVTEIGNEGDEDDDVVLAR